MQYLLFGAILFGVLLATFDQLAIRVQRRYGLGRGLVVWLTLVVGSATVALGLITVTLTALAAIWFAIVAGLVGTIVSGVLWYRNHARHRRSEPICVDR